MATTAFWPVKGSLKAVIDYADNPDKSTNPKYLDDDLAQVHRYAERDDKTDRNQLRRPKPPEVETELKEKITATTNQLKPLRRDLAAARRVSERWRHLYELLQSEREMEIKALKRERSRGR